MLSGIFAGLTWALQTVVLGIALGMTPFISTEQAVLLAPFVSTFLHDTCSAVYMFIYNAVRGKLGRVFALLKSRRAIRIIVASAIGGPVGMTGYVLAVNYMGASVGAVASAVYPAIGTALAYIFLKEKVRWYQWIFLVLALGGVFGLSYSPSLSVGSFWLGLVGALMCAFGWGIEAVILASCFKEDGVENEYVLQIRQTTSSLIYGALIIPILGGWGFTLELFSSDTGWLLPTVAAAALCATVSYLFYYRAISKVGASKAMALNITYTAWAIAFTLLLLQDTSVLNPLTIICAAVVVICGILAATDLKSLFGGRHDKGSERI